MIEVKNEVVNQIKEYFQVNDIGYKFIPDEYEFAIETRFNICLRAINSDVWILSVEGLDVGGYLNSAEYELNMLLGVIKNIVRGDYRIVTRGILRKRRQLETDLPSWESFKVGNLVDRE